MKITLFSVLILILLTVAFLPNGFSQDYTRLNLPEGAKAILSKGRINGVAYSPDDAQVAVATYIGVWMHDPDTGEEIEILPGRFVQSISYSSDGRLLAVAEPYGVKLWDTVNHEYITTLKDGGGYSVAFSPDGQLIASGDGWGDGTVYIWDVATGQLKVTLAGHTDLVPSVAFSPDGQTLATASYDHTVRLWDVNTGRHKTTLMGHTYRVSGVAFSPDGQTLATADGRVRLWDAFTGLQKETLEGYGHSVTYSPDGSILASNLQMWDAATGERKIRFFGPIGTNVSFRSDGQMMAIGKELRDVATGQPNVTFDGYGGSWVNVSFSPDGEILATASGRVRLWDAATGLYRTTLTGGGGKSIAFSPNGQMIASSDGWLNAKLRIWDVATEQLKLTLEGHTGEINSIAFSGDSRTIATASDDKTVRLWDITTGRLKATLLGHTEGVTSVAFSQDSQTLASTGYGYDGDYAIRVWDANTGELKSTLTGHTYRITSLAFSPDGRTLASGSWDSTVRLWDVSTGKRKSSLSGFTCGIRSLAFSPDNSTLMIGNAQFNVQWLDVNTGEILATFRGHGSQVNSVAFSADGYTFASGGDSGVIFLWDLTSFIEYTPLGNRGTQQPQTDAVIKPYEREMVRIIYFQPSDRLPRKGINTQLDTLIRWTQYFYAEQMQTYGERKTFAFETNEAGYAQVHHIIGKFNDAYYHQDTYRKVVEEVAEQFDTSRDIYLIAADVSSEFINNEGTCGIGGGGWNSFDNDLWRRDFGGTAVIPASGVCINPSVTAHELGHVFGLEHDFRDDAYLMAYGTQQRLSHCAAEWLDTHRFFNNDPTFFSEATTMDMLSSVPSGPDNRRLRFQLSDADGLHQAQLIVPVATTDPAPGTKLHGCESLSSEHQTVEFTVPGLEAAPGVEVTLQVIDAHGNITKQTFPVLVENRVLNREPTIVSTIPFQTLTVGGNATSLNMSLYFSDPDSDNLRYTAESDNTSVATVSVSGTQIVITPKGIGSAIVTVTASDGTFRVVQYLSVHVSSTLIANAADTFGDPFEGTTLQNPNWQWQNEPANWDIGETRDGFLHINAETHRNLWASDASHFLYQETDADTFDVETHFFTRWDTASGVNGLVVKSPADNNWVTIKFWSRDAAAKGQIQYQTRGQGLVADPAWRPEFGVTELFLRLRKQGDTYTGWYKTREAEPWIEIGVANFLLTPPLQLGIYAGVAAGTGTLTVDYDYFRSTIDTGILASPVLQIAAMETPTETTLLPNYPNPFNPETWIPYRLSSPSNVTVRIYAINGNLVRRLVLGHQATGVYQSRSRAAYWDGKNELGEPVASGLYFYTLTAGDFTATRKMLIRK